MVKKMPHPKPCQTCDKFLEASEDSNEFAIQSHATFSFNLYKRRQIYCYRFSFSVSSNARFFVRVPQGWGGNHTLENQVYAQIEKHFNVIKNWILKFVHVFYYQDFDVCVQIIYMF